MCLIAFAVDAHPDFKLILAANRDEFFDRPTRIANYWSDKSGILGGRDAKANGTWMAVNRIGGFSAVTNFRDLKNIRPEAKSRGELPVNFLLGQDSSKEYLENLQERASEYNGFNLLTYDASGMYHFSNYEGVVNKLNSGIYGLSNALLDTSWPKVNRLKEKFEEVISMKFDHQDLLFILTDPTLAKDEDLPDTGVGYELEKMLSSICINSEKYGTCCSTVLTISRDGEIEFTEKSYPVGGREKGLVSFKFKLEG